MRTYRDLLSNFTATWLPKVFLADLQFISDALLGPIVNLKTKNSQKRILRVDKGRCRVDFDVFSLVCWALKVGLSVAILSSKYPI